MYKFSALLGFVAITGFSILSATHAAPVTPLIIRAQATCFTPGKNTLPAEIADGLPTLAKAVTCISGKTIANTGGVPDVKSGAVTYSSIDFQQSAKSAVGFALQTFPTPADPAKGDLAKFQDQLNVYLAMESGVRSTGSKLLNELKGPKFFLQFQIARIKTAQGVKLSFQQSVEHQLGKVTKNAPGATAAELAAVTALSKVV